MPLLRSSAENYAERAISKHTQGKSACLPCSRLVDGHRDVLAYLHGVPAEYFGCEDPRRRILPVPSSHHRSAGAVCAPWQGLPQLHSHFHIPKRGKGPSLECLNGTEGSSADRPTTGGSPLNRSMCKGSSAMRCVIESRQSDARAHYLVELEGALHPLLSGS